MFKVGRGICKVSLSLLSDNEGMLLSCSCHFVVDHFFLDTDAKLDNKPLLV